MKRLAALTLAALPLASLFIRAQVPACDMNGYHALPGPSASNGADGLTVTWDGERDRDVRLRLGIDAGTPTIRELAIRRKGLVWTTLAAQPEFRVVSGFRRMSNQQPTRRQPRADVRDGTPVARISMDMVSLPGFRQGGQPWRSSARRRTAGGRSRR
jgi:hypothetical protein